MREGERGREIERGIVIVREKHTEVNNKKVQLSRDTYAMRICSSAVGTRSWEVVSCCLLAFLAGGTHHKQS